jgi:hypothetical protein
MAEMAIIKLCTPETSSNASASNVSANVNDVLIERIEKLETKVSTLEKKISATPHATATPSIPANSQNQAPNEAKAQKKTTSQGIAGVPYSDLLDFLND